MKRHHKDAVAEIASDIRRFYDRKQPFRIYHGSTNSTRQSQHRRDNIVDTSKLTHVIKIDTEARTALVEPNVPMDRLVEATLYYGLVPPVVMELPGITIGGGFSGSSGESSSFKYGLFDRTINAIEMVLGNGDIVTASNIERPDLFRGAAASCGTLGVVTLLEIQLIQAKTYAEVTYHPITSVSEALQKIQALTPDAADYVDGILFSKNFGVVCEGHLTDEVREGVKVQRFSRATDPWFYLHAKTNSLRSTTSSPVTEAVPIVDYLFRYDRGAFWVSSYAFKYFVTPFNRVTRWALDKFMHTRVMYHALHKSGLAKQYIIQDLAVPYPAVDEFADFVGGIFGYYPIWLCPLKVGPSLQSPQFSLSPGDGAQTQAGMLLNFGIWGPGPAGREEFVAVNRRLEQKVRALNGMKWLYAHAYYTEKEFWEIYDGRAYEALRAKYNASHLPTLYDKVKVDVGAEKEAIQNSWKVWLVTLFWGIWPLAGLYGVFHTLIRSEYLLPREVPWIAKPKTE